jgi:hypothetical protein
VAHVLIVGTTECGKTTLARQLSAYYKRNGFGVLVLDPLNDPRWSYDFITDDSAEFLDVYWRSRRCIAFMDEGGESVGRYDTAMQQTATRGRHWGHSNHFIAQDPTQLAPVVRSQCSHVFAFALSVRQSKILAEEFNEPLLEGCPRLMQGEYIHAQRFGQAVTNKGAKINAPAISRDDDSRRLGNDRGGTGTGEEEASGTGTGSQAGSSADTEGRSTAGTEEGGSTG